MGTNRSAGEATFTGESRTRGKRWKKDEQRPWEEAAGLAAALRACLRKPASPASSSSPCKQLRAFNWFTISVNNRAIQERRKESGKEKGQNTVTSCINDNTRTSDNLSEHEYTDILIHTHIRIIIPTRNIKFFSIEGLRYLTSTVKKEYRRWDGWKNVYIADSDSWEWRIQGRNIIVGSSGMVACRLNQRHARGEVL